VKRLLITLLKIALSAAIVGYLVYDATQNKGRGNVFANLRDQPKRWDMFAAAWVFCTIAVLITFVRWWYLVRALGIPCRFRDAIRISFWGFLFNLAPLGIVAGDLVKAVMLNHEHRQHRAKAFATVIVDRVIGLYVLFIVASAAILITGFWDIPILRIQQVCQLTFLITALSTVGLAVVMGPGFIVGGAIRAVARIPRVGHHIESLIHAIRMYNRMPTVMIVSSLMTVCVHCSFAVGCYLIAVGLPGNHLSLADHFVVIPLSSAMGVIPLPMGPFEAVLNYFYMHVPVVGPHIPAGQGLVVALAYRFINLLIAALGIRYYFSNRREMAEVIHESESETAGL
jgi:glycosyltransferase 2 family protein